MNMLVARIQFIIYVMLLGVKPSKHLDVAEVRAEKRYLDFSIGGRGQTKVTI